MSFSLVCTTRFDRVLETFGWNNAPDGTPSPYLLLAFQLDRLLSSARLCRWTVTLDYTALQRVCDTAVCEANDGETPLKIRVVVAPSGDVSASVSPVAPLLYDPTAGACFVPGSDPDLQSVPVLSLCVDTQPTSGTVSMKTTNRKPYDDARARVGIPPLGASRDPSYPDDVILFNTSGAIMETSICNLAFYRHGRWLTPPLTVGCIPGVFRRWLLENRRIHEARDHSISVDAIKHNEWVLVFNGVAGCRLGRVCCNRNVQDVHGLQGTFN